MAACTLVEHVIYICMRLQGRPDYSATVLRYTVDGAAQVYSILLYLGDACRIDCVYGFSYILECSAYM